MKEHPVTHLARSTEHPAVYSRIFDERRLFLIQVDCVYTNATFCDETEGAIDRNTFDDVISLHFCLYMV